MQFDEGSTVIEFLFAWRSKGYAEWNPIVADVAKGATNDLFSIDDKVLSESLAAVRLAAHARSTTGVPCAL